MSDKVAVVVWLTREEAHHYLSDCPCVAESCQGEIKDAIRAALSRPEGSVWEGTEMFPGYVLRDGYDWDPYKTTWPKRRVLVIEMPKEGRDE